jgi:hypothetical protein
MNIQVPSDIYVGRNVVRLHLVEFFDIIEERKILAEGEKPLAVFDCILMESGGIRLGGFTLHDYAMVTDRHLITWARGRSKDVVDRLSWSFLTVEKYGQRNALEGTVKITYRPPSTSTRRRISVKPRDESGNRPLDKGQDDSAEKPKSIDLYLDYMPLEEVPICQKMLNFFVANASSTSIIENYYSTFQNELAESIIRLTTPPATARQLYNQQPNGVYIESDEIDEEQVLNLTNHRYSYTNPYRGTSSIKRGYESPYKLRSTEQAYQPGRTGMAKSTGSTNSNRGGNSGMPGFSKLDSLDFGGKQANKPVPPQPAPETRLIRPTPVDKPVSRPAPPPPPVRDEPQIRPRVEYNQPPVGPIPNLPRTDISSVYSVSRIAHGVLEGRQNFSKSLEDVSETATILASLPALLSNNPQARQTALFKLRGIFEGGYLEKDTLMSKAMAPLIQPIISRFVPIPSSAPVEKPKRLSIKVASEKTPIGRRQPKPELEMPDEEYMDQIEPLPFPIPEKNPVVQNIPIYNETYETIEPEIQEIQPEVEPEPQEAMVTAEPKRIKLGKRS